MLFEVYHRPTNKFYKVYYIRDGVDPQFLVYKDDEFKFIFSSNCSLYDHEKEEY